MTEPMASKSKSWRRRKRARPGEILEAALTVFAQKGYAAARMEDIAEAAGVTKGTIYLYFPGKADVFKTLARETVGQALAGVGAQLQTFRGTPTERIVTIVTAINAFLQQPERAALPKIVIAESGNFPELALFWRKEVVDKALPLIVGAFEQGVDIGHFRPLAADMVAKLCVAPLILSVIWRTTFTLSDPEPFDFANFFATHLDVLMNGIRTKGEPQ
jgi:AcrR family transcriptional regulator